MNTAYLATVSDDVKMTPEVFINLMRKFRHHRGVKYGFSEKHTNDIQEYRKQAGLAKNESSIPGNLYNLPVTWNTEKTYVR
jgi:hypothetical protein